MRVLYHHRTMADGAEGIHIREIISALRGLGHEVRVVALSGDPTAPAAAKQASKVASLRRLIPGPAYELAELGYNLVGYRRIMAGIREFKPDVIYDRYNSYSTAATRAARRTGLPLILEVNSPVAYERSVYENLQLKFHALAQRYERRIMAAADRIFAVSTPLKQHLVERVGVDDAKVRVLANGADPERFAPGKSGDDVRRRHGIGTHTVIGFVGILRPWHGVDLLIDAFARLRAGHPAVHLLIVGDGPIEQELAARARSLGLEGAVTFTGRLAHADVVAHVAAMDITVSPHATFYASPMKLLEYMAMGKAVVAPAMDNIRDMIDDGRTGLLFESGSVDALQGAIEALIRDAGLRSALGESARARVIERFNWRYNAQAVVDAATECVRARAASRSIPER
jgi:glycosyltransferase involved in cell wall biosynthesis